MSQSIWGWVTQVPSGSSTPATSPCPQKVKASKKGCKACSWQRDFVGSSQHFLSQVKLFFKSKIQ